MREVGGFIIYCELLLLVLFNIAFNLYYYIKAGFKPPHAVKTSQEIVGDMKNAVCLLSRTDRAC